MFKHIKIITLILLIAAAAYLSCSDRGTNVPPSLKIPVWGITPLTYAMIDYPETDSYLLRFQVRNNLGILKVALYVPIEGWLPPQGTGDRLPLLILLAPENGDEYFYFNHGLKELVDVMIADGEIDPMIICCVANDKVFGGYFYGSSLAAGDYDAIIGSNVAFRLIPRINSYDIAFDSTSKRGIGGIGEGAYGAFRTVIKNPGRFSSLTAADGPLDFDGSSNNGGLINLFPMALAEQGLSQATFLQFDSSRNWPISQMFIGGSLAFSPHVLDATYNLVPISDTQINITSYTVTDSIGDNSTLIEDVIEEDGYKDQDFHLPFDGTGQKVDAIWSYWLANNLDSLYDKADTGATRPFDGVNMWIATSPEAQWYYHDMTQSWIDFLESEQYPVTVETYRGYPGKPALYHEYVYDLMRKMLIFHNENFGGN